MDLKEWTITYVKNKDLLQRKLIRHTEKGDVLTFTFKDKVQDYALQEKLHDCLNYKAPHTTFVNPATPGNLDYVLQHWKELVQHKNLTFLFVNLQTHEKMILHPATHHFIADETTLELGLKSMLAQVAGLPLPPEPKRRKKEPDDEKMEEEE